MLTYRNAWIASCRRPTPWPSGGNCTCELRRAHGRRPRVSLVGALDRPARVLHQSGEALPPEAVRTALQRRNPVDRAAADAEPPEEVAVLAHLHLDVRVHHLDLSEDLEADLVSGHRRKVSRAGWRKAANRCVVPPSERNRTEAHDVEARAICSNGPRSDGSRHRRASGRS